MKTFTLTILCLMVFSIAAYGAKVKGDGKIITKEIQLEDYDEIEIGNGIESGTFSFLNKGSKGKSPVVNYTCESGGAALNITIDENLFPLLKIKLEGKKLYIGTESGTQIIPTRLVIDAHSRQLKKASASGGINLYVKSDLSGDDLELKSSGASDIFLEKNVRLSNKCRIRVSGAGDLKAHNLSCNNIECRVSGSGDVELRGTAEEGSFRVSGSGDIKAYDFVVKRLECSVSGSGDIKANASETIDASASGSGDVKYRGNAKANIRTSGSGDVTRVN